VKEDWHSLPSLLSSLGHDVLVFDHRGMGESSEHGSEDGGYTMEQMADDCTTLTRHVFPSTQVHLMGISSQTYMHSRA
jgi:pimeloyl-ACP methyl ester carboxylesterase